MYDLALEGWGTDIKNLLKDEASAATKLLVSTIADPATEALISYFDKNGIQVWRRAKPVLERFIDTHGDEMSANIKPVMTRMLDRQRKKYGRASFYPRYGKYAPVAFIAGSAMFLGSLGTGYHTLQVVKEKDTETAAPWLVGSYLLHLGGLALTVVGALLYAGNQAFPKE